MNYLTIREEVFTEVEMQEITGEANENWKIKRDPLWFEIRSIDEGIQTTMSKTAKRIYESIKTNCNFEITNKSGLEIWININKRHGLHYDCDEALRKLTGLVKHPIVSSVYYLKVPDEGGELVLYKNASNRALEDVYSGNKESTALGYPEKIKPRRKQLSGV